MSGRAAAFDLVLGVWAVLLGSLSLAHPRGPRPRPVAIRGTLLARATLATARCGDAATEAFYFYPVPTGES